MAARVMMSRAQALWVFMEGRSIDAAFYDRLLDSNARAASAGYRVRLIETMELNSSFGGGKQAALKLFDHYKRAGKLVQHNSLGPRRMIFMLDLDLDGALGTRRRHDHVIYTSARDVEAEIHLNGNLRHALSTSLSLTRHEADRVAAGVGNHVDRLGQVWREWIELGVLLAGLQSRCALSPGKVSVINTGTYGPTDPALHTTAITTALINARVPAPLTKHQFLSRRVAAAFRRGEGHLLVKGKWLPAYLNFAVRPLFPAGAPVDYKGVNTLTKCLLDTLDFSGAWAQPYHDSIDRVA